MATLLERYGGVVGRRLIVVEDQARENDEDYSMDNKSLLVNNDNVSGGVTVLRNEETMRDTELFGGARDEIGAARRRAQRRGKKIALDSVSVLNAPFAEDDSTFTPHATAFFLRDDDDVDDGYFGSVEDEIPRRRGKKRVENKPVAQFRPRRNSFGEY